ncbi:hypothetical protein D8S93_24470 [Vibrio sp. VGrn 2]|uniref:shikimate kinase n=1 Tax=Vibrio TaxID=662 RepID=UPI00112478A4|nr:MULTISPECIES: shikimate kinase [Vibrio]MPS41716.1 hypothetical protein [Vibrio sp. VGrn 2]TOA11267.1 hypothetical protein CGK33_23855 [Vibrio parahaemolyticus]
MNIDEIIQNILQLDSPITIGIEGASGSGKTTLGRELASRLSIEFVDLDSFVISSDEPVPYITQIDMESLQARVTELLESNRTFIILGICLRDVLAMISATVGICIYVKKVSSMSLWHYGFDIESYASGSDPSGIYDFEPYKSDMKYHQNVQPHMNSELVYEYVAD